MALRSNTDEFLKFAKRMEVLGGEIEKNILKMKKRVAMRAIEHVARNTPADTGLARTNWITTVGSSTSKKIKEPAFPGSHLGMGDLMNAQYAIGQAIIALHPTSILKGKRIYIQNNQPYIGALNRGKSRQQSTAGFVERAVLIGLVEALKGKLVPRKFR